MKKFTLALFSATALLGCDQQNSMLNDRTTKDATTPVVNRDNSAVNKRDVDTDAKTPFDQNENKADIGITASIRRSVVDTKMSTNAQNVKIITQDGNVTLRGPVQTQEEKDRIDEIARKVAGVKAVDSQLEVNKNP
jgi:osmotically-inducible protein OsmY